MFEVALLLLNPYDLGLPRVQLNQERLRLNCVCKCVEILIETLIWVSFADLNCAGIIMVIEGLSFKQRRIKMIKWYDMCGTIVLER
jgi:hypothetical protein